MRMLLNVIGVIQTRQIAVNKTDENKKSVYFSCLLLFAKPIYSPAHFQGCHFYLSFDKKSLFSLFSALKKCCNLLGLWHPWNKKVYCNRSLKFFQSFRQYRFFSILWVFSNANYNNPFSLPKHDHLLNYKTIKFSLTWKCFVSKLVNALLCFVVFCKLLRNS